MIIGVDPGHEGAIALYNPAHHSLAIWDMPVFHMTVGKTRKPRIDPVEVWRIFEGCKAMGADLAVMEAVGGRPKQSAHAAFIFGWGAGQVAMACVGQKIPLEPVPPTVWKRMMKAPKEKKASVARADALFPESAHQFRGAKNGLKDGRAEAAMMALFGHRHVQAAAHDREWHFIKERTYK